MSLYQVISVIVNLSVNPPTISEQTTDEIDTETNELYQDCVTVRDVEIRFEGFWNYLNFNDTVHTPSQKVKALSVVRLSGPVPDAVASDVHKILTKVRAKKSQ